MDRYKLYTEYQTKEKKIIVGLDLHFSYNFSSYIFSSFYAKYYILFHPDNRISYDNLPVYVHSQHQESKIKKSFKCVCILSSGSLHTKIEFQYALVLVSLKIKVENLFRWQNYENLYFSLNEFILPRGKKSVFVGIMYLDIKKRCSFIFFSFPATWERSFFLDSNFKRWKWSKVQPALGY